MAGLTVGQEIGAYTIEAHIASGGMGGVYRARHRTIDRVAALKTLLPQHADDEALIERLKREARAIAALRHPNIVEIYDAQFDTQPFFIAMAYAPHGTLYSRLRELRKQNGRMSEADAIDITRQIASALAYAHRAGIIHRDIKPSNILIDADGRSVVSDFGIAVRDSDQTRLTEDFAAMGTPDYTSPEQARGEKPDARTDIYALGTLLYEMLAGNAPYASDTPWSVINKHMTAPPPDLLEVRPNATPALRDLIVKAMAKEPGARFASCDDMIAAIDIIRDGRDPQIATTVGSIDATQPMNAPVAPARASVPKAPGATPQPPPQRAISPMMALSITGLLVGLLGVGIAIYTLLSTRSASPEPISIAAAAPTTPSTPPPATLIVATTAASTQTATDIAPTATALPAPPSPTTPAVATAPAAATIASSSAVLATDEVLGDDFLNGWEDWSWGGTSVAIVSDVPPHSGRKVIKAQFKEQFGGLQFGRQQPISMNGAVAVELFVRASEDGPVNIQIELTNDKVLVGRSDTIAISDSENWQSVRISVNPTSTSLGQIKVIAMDEQAGRAFFVDDVRIVRSAAATDTGCGAGATRDVWLNASGAGLKDIPTDRAPDQTDSVLTLESFRQGEFFAERIRGYLCPARDGDYIFFIASDDSGQLSLSTDESPANLNAIASVKLWTLQSQWDKESSQRSAPVKLRAGQRYYFEVLHKQGEQGSHVEVAWQGPELPFGVIAASALAPAQR
jgi:eukaryotic-like serine/threonine-protein kinase